MKGFYAGDGAASINYWEKIEKEYGPVCTVLHSEAKAAKARSWRGLWPGQLRLL